MDREAGRRPGTPLIRETYLDVVAALEATGYQRARGHGYAGGSKWPTAVCHGGDSKDKLSIWPTPDGWRARCFTGEARGCHGRQLHDSIRRTAGLAGISHIGSLQTQRAAQARWEHHRQVLQGQSIAGLSDKGCDSCREPCFLSFFVVFGSPANEVKAHRRQADSLEHPPSWQGRGCILPQLGAGDNRPIRSNTPWNNRRGIDTSDN